MNLLISSIKKHYLPALAFLIPLTVYLLTLYPTVPTEDGGELITAAYHLGIPHPPGYPLFTILGKIFIVLNPFGNIAWKVNVMSAVFNAATALVIFLFLRRYIKSNIIALASGLLFTFIDISWSQAIRAEVYSLHNFLHMLVIFCVYQWQKDTKNLFWWYAICFTFGLGLTNHHVLFVFSPPLALFVLWADKTLWKDWKRILSGTAFFILGLSIYLYLPIRSLADPALDWGNPETLNDFWRHVTRAQYGGTVKLEAPATIPEINLGDTTIAFQENAVTEFFKPFIAVFARTLRFAMTVLPVHLYEVTRQFLYFIAPLALLGFWRPEKKSSKFHWFLIINIVFYGLVMTHFVDGLNEHGEYRSSSRPFLLSFLLLFTLLTGVGLNKFFSIIKKKIPKTPTILVNILVLAIPIAALAANYHTNDQHNNYLNYDINKYILSSVPDNSVIYNEHDESHDFGIMYLQLVENFKPEVILFGEANKLPYQSWPGIQTLQQTHPNHHMFSLNEPPDDNVFFQIMPHGVIYRLVLPENYDREKSKELAAYYGQEAKNLKFRDAEADNLDIRSIVLVARLYQNISNYVYLADPKLADEFLEKAEKILPKRSSNYEIIASQYLKFGEANKAIEILKKSAALEPNRFHTTLNFGIAYEFLGQTDKAQEYFAKAEEIDSQRYYFELSNRLKRAGICDQAFLTLQKVYPDQLPWVHIETANCYISDNQNDKAINHLLDSIDLLPADHEAIPEIKNKIRRLQ